MTKFTILSTFNPERSGGIYSTVAIPNLPGKQMADPFHFVIPNAVVGSKVRLQFQLCQAISQPDLSLGRDDKVYNLLDCHPERSVGTYNTLLLSNLLGKQITDPSPLCHPELSGGIYSTVAIPNLLGHHTARSLLGSR